MIEAHSNIAPVIERLTRYAARRAEVAAQPTGGSQWRSADRLWPEFGRD